MQNMPLEEKLKSGSEKGDLSSRLQSHTRWVIEKLTHYFRTLGSMINSVDKVYLKRGILLYFVILTFPLIATAITRPLAHWDYLTTYTLFSCPTNHEMAFSTIVPNWLCQFEAKFVFRPTSTVMYNLQYRIFGGEFWLWYLVKWSAKFVAVLLTVKILRNIGVVNKLVQWVVGAFLWFHPVPFELMLFSLDGWVAFWNVLILTFVLSLDKRFGKGLFNISDINLPSYCGLFLLWFFGLGVKEVELVFGIIFVLFMMLFSKWSVKTVLRFIPFWGVSVFWAIHLFIMFESRKSPSTGMNSLSAILNYLGAFWEKFISAWKFILPHSPYNLVAWGMLILGILYIYQLVKSVRVNKSIPDPSHRIGLFCVVCVLGILVFLSLPTSTPPNLFARYVLPIIYLITIPLAVAIPQQNRLLKWVGMIFLLLYPVWTASSLYMQSLAYQKQLYELSDMINRVEEQTTRGYAIAVSGENEDNFRPESQTTIRLFFEKFERQYYNHPSVVNVNKLSENPIDANRYVLISGFSLKDIFDGKVKNVDISELASIEVFRRQHFGLFEEMTMFFNRINEQMNNKYYPYYDGGSPAVSNRSQFYMYIFDRNIDNNSISQSPQSTLFEWNDPSGKGMKSFAIDRTNEFAFSPEPGRSFVTKALLPMTSPYGQVLFDGEVKVEEGVVSFGITDENGKDLWSYKITPAEEWQGIRSPDPLEFKEGVKYYYFFYTPIGSSFSVKNFASQGFIPIELLEPSRRYGAITY